jgi:hypothetical protein
VNKLTNPKASKSALNLESSDTWHPMNSNTINNSDEICKVFILIWFNKQLLKNTLLLQKLGKIEILMLRL